MTSSLAKGIKKNDWKGYLKQFIAIYGVCILASLFENHFI